jgi:hypothetical protein
MLVGVVLVVTRPRGSLPAFSLDVGWASLSSMLQECVVSRKACVVL